MIAVTVAMGMAGSDITGRKPHRIYQRGMLGDKCQVRIGRLPVDRRQCLVLAEACCFGCCRNSGKGPLAKADPDFRFRNRFLAG